MFGLGVVTGEFDLRDGHVDVAESISDSTVEAVVNADSFHTGNPTRDRTVRSATYLDVGKYPDLRFVADGLQSSGQRWTVHGTLDAHGVSVPLQITVHAVDATVGEVTFDATAQVDRYAHGITAGRGMAGRRLAIEIVAVATAESIPTAAGGDAFARERPPRM